MMRLRTLWIGIALLAAAAGLAVWGTLRSYRVFTQEELVAVVRCGEDPQGSRELFLLEVAAVRNGIPDRAESFAMSGDQWTIGGEILKWRPWAVFLGLRSRHKLTRLQSRYADAQAEQTRPRSVHELGGGPGAGWRWLRRWGAHLPGVDAVYGSAAYVDARRGKQWGVYVTHSGYFIRVSVQESPAKRGFIRPMRRRS